MPKNSFADRLVRARAAKGLSQGALAEASGIAPPQVSRYERGVSIPRPHIAAKLANVLGVTDEWLAQGEGDGPRGGEGSVADEIERLEHEKAELARWFHGKEAEAKVLQALVEMLASFYVDLWKRLPAPLRSDPSLDATLRLAKSLVSEKHVDQGLKAIYEAADPAVAARARKFRDVVGDTSEERDKFGAVEGLRRVQIKDRLVTPRKRKS